MSEFVGKNKDKIIYIVRRTGIFGDYCQFYDEQPNLDNYYPEGTEIYKAKVIARFESKNIVK